MWFRQTLCGQIHSYVVLPNFGHAKLSLFTVICNSYFTHNTLIPYNLQSDIRDIVVAGVTSDNATFIEDRYIAIDISIIM